MSQERQMLVTYEFPTNDDLDTHIENAMAFLGFNLTLEGTREDRGKRGRRELSFQERPMGEKMRQKTTRMHNTQDRRTRACLAAFAGVSIEEIEHWASERARLNPSAIGATEAKP